MVEPTPLLSIVMPTRNRASYALAAIRSVLQISGNDFEVVVEDNSTDSDLESALKQDRDLRLRYVRDESQRSMSENFDAAVERARGEYICVVGDDDGVNPEILQAARWADRHRVEALSSSTPAHYVWPDLSMRSPGAMRPSELRIHEFSGLIERVEPSVELEACLKLAGQRFERLPRPYYGLVRRSCYERVRQVAGTAFPGVSPDLAGAVALAGVVRECWYVDYPLFLPGSSGRSNAGMSGLKRHVGRLNDQPHLPRGCEARWSAIVPPFYSVQTVWAESVVSALHATGQVSRLGAFNVPYLYAWLLVFHPSFREQVRRQFRPALAAIGIGSAWGRLQCAYYVSVMWALRAKALLRRLFRVRPAPILYRKEGLESIKDAVDELRMFLGQSRFHFPV